MENPFEAPKQENGLSLSIIVPSKAEIAVTIDGIVKNIRKEDEDYLGRYIQTKALEEVVKGVLEAIKKDAEEEAEKLGKDAKYMGAAVSVKNLANKYGYDHNETWVTLKDQEKQIKEAIKKVEEQMVLAMKYSEIVDDEGTVITPAVLKEAGGSTIAITLSKK